MRLRRYNGADKKALAAGLLACTIVFAGGCGAADIPAQDAPAESEAAPETDSAAEPAAEEDLHMAEAVPYVEREKDGDGNADVSETGDDTGAAADEENASEEPEEYLEGYETESDWKSRHTGSASYISGTTVIVSIFVDEEEDLWTEEEKEQMFDIYSIGYEYIMDTMKDKYDTDTELIYDWHEDPELKYGIRVYEDIPAYVEVEQEDHMDDLEAEWVSQVPYRELCKKYETDSIAFLYLIPHEGCSYSSMHFTEDGEKIWNEGCLLYLQDMYSPDLDPETPTVFAHELLHVFGAEDYYSSAEVFSKETYDALARECSDDIMLRTFETINGVYTTFPGEVYGEITPITAYLLGIGDDDVVEDIPELIRAEAACFPGHLTDRPF